VHDKSGEAAARGFGSDNHSGVHPDIMAALVAANVGHSAAYQMDATSRACAAVWRRHFGAVEVFYVFNGTAANVLALKACMPSYGSVLCSDVAHLHVDACAAPEYGVGCKVQPVPSLAGKINVAALQPFLLRPGDQHYAAPRALSISQPTELGTVYSVDELRDLCAFARRHHLTVHMDGARLVHAANYLGVSLAAITADVGVNVLSFGGTKNGLLGGEAVVFFDHNCARDFKYIRKQMLQLPSKTRFMAAQFQALLTADLWQQVCRHAHHMAMTLACEIAKLPAMQVMYPVQANAVFVRIPRQWVKQLRRQHFFYVWQNDPTVIRLMTTFDTELAEIEAFVAACNLCAASA
jgi:threonine aldolase